MNKLARLPGKGPGYECWMCGARHKEASAYLWHIKECKLSNAAARLTDVLTVQQSLPILAVTKK